MTSGVPQVTGEQLLAEFAESISVSSNRFSLELS